VAAASADGVVLYNAGEHSPKSSVGRAFPLRRKAEPQMFTSMSPLEKFSVPSVAKFRRFPGEHWRERRRAVRPEDVGLEILVNIEETKTSAGSRLKA